MEIRFWPEGRLLDTEENRKHCSSLPALQSAMEANTVVEGIALMCSPSHDISVKLNSFIGTIPREEGAIGIAEGTTRDIALLSRVGKPVAVVVTAINDNGTLLLSRRKAQEKARNYLMEQARPGDILPATVTHMEPFGAFVDIGCGLPSMLGIENLSVSRISHPNRRFTLGQEIFAIISEVDPTLGRVYLTHKELLGTWSENAAGFVPGMTIPGIIRGVKEYGVFVELTPNLSGLAETKEDLTEGDRVSVFIKSILPERMKIKLLVIDKLAPDPTPVLPHYYQTEGRICRWEYAPQGCNKVGAISIFADQS